MVYENILQGWQKFYTSGKKFYGLIKFFAQVAVRTCGHASPPTEPGFNRCAKVSIDIIITN
jgi:hypothetical protein